MKRKQVFVRALAEYGETRRWVDCDVLDLDDESYRAFTTDILMRAGALFHLKDEVVEGEHTQYRVKKELAKKYIDEKDRKEVN